MGFDKKIIPEWIQIFSILVLAFADPASASEYADRIFRLEVKELASPSVVSVSTSFVVHPEGYLLTTFNSVSLPAFHPDKYEILVTVGESAAIAQIDSFDVLENIALLRVGRTFQNVFRIEQGTVTPAIGEEHLLIGVSDPFSYVSNATQFLGSKKMGSFARFDYFFHLKKGMEGAPILNSSGNVVSMALPVAFGKNSSSSGVRLKEMQRMVNSIGKKRSVASSSGMLTDIVNQIFDGEKNFEALSLNEKRELRKSFHGVSFLPPGINSKCHIENLSKGTLRGAAYSCYEKPQIELNGKIQLMNSKFFVLDEPSLEGLVEDFPRIADFLGKPSSRTPSSVTSICTVKNVQNTSNVRMIVRFCSKEEPGSGGMYSTVTKTNFVDPAYENFVIHNYFSGMSYEFTVDRIADFLESIQLVKR